MNRYTRREFLRYSLTAAAGAALLPYAGCGSRSAGRDGVLEVPAGGYPLLEVSGPYREIGRQIGLAMREQIAGCLQLSPDYRGSVDYLEGEGRGGVERMLGHARAAFPHLVEEVEGMAEALEIPFEKLFAFQCRSEINILREPPGCSTIVLHDGDTLILAHNEDGNDLNVGRMFLVKATTPGGMTFLSFVYPGLLPGVGPGMNSAGIVQTTNYIQPLRAADGVPRYFIGCAILEAGSLDEAVSLATMRPRAFSWHHNLLSLPERRILSVETAAFPEARHSILDVDGFYIHTNHLIHPDMTGPGGDAARPYDVPYESSTTRMAVLKDAVASQGAPANAEEIMKLLTIHEGRPYSPCRHPRGDVHGVTLGTALFTAPDRTMMLYHGNPCRGFKRKYVL